MAGLVSRVRAAPSRVFYGWWIVAIGTIVTSVGSIYFYGFTVFFLPLSADLHLSRASTSLIFSLARLEGGLEGPLVGWLVDKFGPRRLLLAGALLAGMGFLLLPLAHSFWAFILVYMGLVSLGFNTGFFQAILAAVNSWFVRQRTVAMSAITAAFRLGGAFLTPLFSLVVLTYGWRTGAIMAGLMVLVIVPPLSFLVRRSPESMGLLPDGDRAGTAQTRGGDQAISQDPSFAVGEALRTPTYWLMAVATGLRIAVFSGMMVHLVPIFVWKGVEKQMAANLVGTAAFISIPTALFFGWAGDRLNKRAIVATGALCSATAMLLLLTVRGTWPIYPFVALFAVGEAVSAVNWSLLGELFGRKSFATLRGIMNAVYSLGVLAPVYAGWVYDRTQSYGTALLAFAAIGGLASLLFITLPKPRRRQLAPAARQPAK